MGIFNQKDGKQDPPEEQKDNAGTKAPKKTTPDEGKTFDKDTVFVCVQDCWRNMTRFRRGDLLTGRTCPPYFAVKPAEGSKK